LSDSALSGDLPALARFFVGDGTVQETLTRVANLTLDAVPAAELVGITMIVEGRQRTAVFTDEEAVEIDRAQYESGEGPCLSAFKESRVTQIESTAEPGEWAHFRNTAAAHGVRSTISFPLLVDRRGVGALNLYARIERAFTADDRTTGERFAAQAAIVLANSLAYWDAHELSVGLAEAMKNRAMIEQAKGILMGAEGVSPDAAFDMLVHASQRENLKLREVARRLVENAQARGHKSSSGSGDAKVDGVDRGAAELSE